VRGYLIALVVFVFLASGNLVRSAEGMPLGWQRDVSLALATSVDRVSNLLSLNRPYDWAAGELGLEQENADFEFATTDEEQPQSVTTTTLPPLRVPTPADPLKVVMAGDSTAIGVGDRLKVAASDNPELEIDQQGKVATGLARSDYFNWGARMKELTTELSPDVVLFMIGANDAQAVLDPDGTVVAQFGTPAWSEAYRQRIGGIMDLAHEGGSRLMWVGEPNVGNAQVQQALSTINLLAEDEAAKRPWVSYFDMAAVVGGPDGEFSEYVTFPDGKQVRCFSGDAVHMSLACLDHAMDRLLPAVQELYGTSPAATTTTMPAPTTGASKATTTTPTTTTKPRG